MLHWMYDRFYLWWLRVFEGKWRGDKNASLSLHIELGILFLYNISIENSGGKFLSLLKIFVKTCLNHELLIISKFFLSYQKWMYSTNIFRKWTHVYWKRGQNVFERCWFYYTFQCHNSIYWIVSWYFERRYYFPSLIYCKILWMKKCSYLLG